MVAVSGIAAPGALPHWRVWALALGLAVLAIPTIITLGNQEWSRDSGAHGPLVLGTAAWLFWRARGEFRDAATEGSRWLTTLGFLLALPMYVFGRAYGFISLEVAGLYGVFISMLHAEFGLKALFKNWFPIFYLAFLIPPPGWLMDDLTAPLKLFASWVATDGLQFFGLPISREGVTLIVGHYQLLVEDACSGMNSLTGLVAISLFYIYLLRNASWRYSLFLACFVIPIAVAANIVRIVILVLLTYFFGDAVAQGFLHQTAGLVLFATSLSLVFVIDNLASRFWPRAKGQPA